MPRFLTMAPPLKLWDKIELFVNDGLDVAKYVTRVEDFTADTIMVSEPLFVEGCDNVACRNGYQFIALIKKEDAIYQFQSTVNNVYRDGKWNLSFPLPPDIKRIQRRDSVRIRLREKIYYARLSGIQFEEDRIPDIEWIQSCCFDISGTGIFISLAGKIRKKDVLILHLPFLKDAGLPEYLLGVCRRVSRTDEDFFGGIEFLEVTKMLRHFSDKIINRLPSEFLKFNIHAQNRLIDYILKEQIRARNESRVFE